MIFRLLRDVSRKTGVPSEEPFRKIVIDFFNTLASTDSQRSKEYWCKLIKNDLEMKFPGILNDNEKSIEFNLWDKCISAHKRQFFEVLLEMLKISIDGRAMDYLNDEVFRFVQPGLYFPFYNESQFYF